MLTDLHLSLSSLHIFLRLPLGNGYCPIASDRNSSVCKAVLRRVLHPCSYLNQHGVGFPMYSSLTAAVVSVLSRGRSEEEQGFCGETENVSASLNTPGRDLRLSHLSSHADMGEAENT